MVIRELQNAPRILQEWDIPEPAQDALRLRVELLRRWVVASKPLIPVRAELNHIEPVAQSLYRAATGLYRAQKLDEAVTTLGWRVRPLVYLWWMAEEVVRTVRSDTPLEEWLRAQEWGELMTRGEKQRLGGVMRSLGGVLQSGVSSLIEAAAKSIATST